MKELIRRFLTASFYLAILLANAAVQSKNKEATHIADGNFILQTHLQFGINMVSERDLFWNYAETIAPDADFDSDADWLELYIKPGVSFNSRTNNSVTLFGKVSAVGSYTAGTDAYDTGDTGRLTLEEAHIGIQHESSQQSSLELSLGPRELKLGTGMLIANGGSSGFERGAIKFGPRKAWEMAAITKVKIGGSQATLFYLDANEMPSNNSNTTLAGLDYRYNANLDANLGITYGKVLKSDAPYPQAAPSGIGPPTITPGARDGLNLLNSYIRSRDLALGSGELFLTGELAYEWQTDIDMSAWAGRIQLTYTFVNRPWTPALSYSFQSFSGDDPDTNHLERFDPLFYEGSPSSWATGSKSSMVFINSNVNAHQLALRITSSHQDTITLRYAHIRANELRSPIQFGQATRINFSDSVPTIITGVTDPHLSDDLFLEYNRALDQYTYLTAGASISVPGKGTDSVINTDASYWLGGFINVVVNF